MREHCVSIGNTNAKSIGAECGYGLKGSGPGVSD